jgi:D-alanyl-D-alanine carboxypeptidase
MLRTEVETLGHSRAGLVLLLACGYLVSCDPLTLNAPRAILTYPAADKTLYSKSPDEQVLQGSLAKLMTGYVALWAVNQKIVSLDDLVTISPRDTLQGCTCMNQATNVSRTLCTGTTVTGNFPQTQAGEVFKFRDLFMAMLNQSAGEATDAVAAHVAANVLNVAEPTASTPCAESEKLMNVFVGLMNQLSKELGLEHSRWVTVHGGDVCDFSIGCNPECGDLDCVDACQNGEACSPSGTTTRDLAKLWYALSKAHPLFLQAVGARKFSIASTLGSQSVNYSFTHGYSFGSNDYPGMDGDKNGSSAACPSAGCWVMQNTRAGRSLIASVLQAGSFNNGRSDCDAMFRYGFRSILAPDRRVDNLSDKAFPSGGSKTEPVEDHKIACNEGMCFSAYTTANKKLKLIAWSVDVDNHKLTRSGAFPAGNAPDVSPAVADFDVAAHDYFIVVGYVSGANVKLASFWLESGALPGTVKIQFLADTGQLAGNGKSVRVLSLSDDQLLTVVRESSGALRLATWKLSAGGAFSLLSTTGTTAQTAEELAVAAARQAKFLIGDGPAPFQVVTATTQAGGSIRLHSWSVDPSTGVITFQKTSQAVDLAEQVSNISVAASGSGKFATAATKGTSATGTHEIVFWNVDADGTFTRTFASTQGSETAASTAIAPLGPGALPPLLGPSPSAFVTAAIVDGSLKIVTWDLPKFLNEGNPADYRVADGGSTGGAGAAIRLAKIRGTGPPDERYMTAMKQTDGTLLLIGWALGK